MSGLAALRDELTKKKKNLQRPRNSSKVNSSSPLDVQNQFEDARMDSCYKPSFLPSRSLRESSEDGRRARSKRAGKDTKNKEKYEEDLALIRSREALIRKSRLYDERIKSIAQSLREGEDYDGELLNDEESDGNTEPLVDFQRKAINLILRPNDYTLPEQDIDSDGDEPKDDGDESDLAWTEYLDSFGRTRRCLKSELKTLKKLDQELQENDGGRVPPTPPANAGTSQPNVQTSHTIAAYRKAHVKYRDLLADEVRDHGIGYYQLSSNEAERQRQLSTFSDMRKERIRNKGSN